ncbi:lysoplasmalogenase [Sediminibacterium goheungense]|uniref:Putative membrane protein YhhN n=1 Tax=Sediminibacterium goheungense TaxID=1086393 RepID=A0A4V3C493_9BACT|nr:lysoplasmalogenase [Sediminibacterium goheungense]TDO23435.1 putative membrane protein YhhN [Sediminibacterium goheungense]TDO25038.1 putative membrane protein YhhN [Sediminibacterium goheungense]
MSKRKILLVIFLLLLLMHCFSIQVEMNQIRTITKVMLVPLLILHLIVNRSFTSAGYLPLIALFFSWLGDILLLGEGTAFFLSGMTAFVMTHVSYSLGFLKIHPVTTKDRGYFLYPFMALLIVSSLVFFFLRNDLGSYLIPVFVYMMFISGMAALALHTYANQQVKAIVSYTFIPGALLFVISDALLAINMFRMHHPVLEVLVMLTYGLAQFFIVRGIQKTSELSV